jgi:thiamine biosynthesis lipoprotein
MPLDVVKQRMKLMGNQFEISVVAKQTAWANQCINQAVAEIKRVEKLLTTFLDDSETNLINKAAGLYPVQVSEETFRLIERSIRISKLTQGAFDVTYGSIDKDLWNFNLKMQKLPDTATAKKMVRLINYKNIILNENNFSVFLKHEGMRIGFGGIGKGYAADRAKQVLLQCGVESGIVNASGDLTAWGLQPNGQQWTIGIAHPDAANAVFSYFNISNMAVATSGNYEKFIWIDGKKYSHTINPKTGLPVTGIKSVTIITTHAEIADAMATPVTIMGIEAGLHMINQMNNIEAIIVDDNNRVFTSDHIHIQQPKLLKK